MSASEPFTVPTDGDTDGTPIEAFGTIDPKLMAGGVEFDPPVVTRIDGILPWETEQDTNHCGETYTEQNGDHNHRVTVEGICFKRHLSTLADLRLASEDVRVISDMTDALGFSQVSFDRMEIERDAETSMGNFTYQGDSITEPLYTFQLQSKENESGNSGGLFG